MKFAFLGLLLTFAFQVQAAPVKNLSDLAGKFKATANCPEKSREWQTQFEIKTGDSEVNVYDTAGELLNEFKNINKGSQTITEDDNGDLYELVFTNKFSKKGLKTKLVQRGLHSISLGTETFTANVLFVRDAAKNVTGLSVSTRQVFRLMGWKLVDEKTQCVYEKIQ